MRSAFLTIVRSFQSLKSRPPLPTRAWRKNGDPGDSTTIQAIAASSRGLVTSNATAETNMSNTRRIVVDHRVPSGGVHPSSRICAVPLRR